MKVFPLVACAATPLFLLHSLAVSCDRLGEERTDGTGRLCIRFDPELRLTKVGDALPDTCDFNLLIRNAKGDAIYDGAYGDCPESLELKPGSYTVSAVSCKFNKPAFDSPQFGDEQCVVVASGGRTDVRLVCSQLNAGISLDVSSDFITSCPNSVLFLKSSAGKLMYSYSEDRMAYFPPDVVSIVMSTGTSDEVIFTRELKPRDMVTVKVTAPAVDASVSKGISLSIDTVRVWSTEQCSAGGVLRPSSGVLTVAQAMSSVGATDVWVSGYVVGGDLTSASASYESPFKSRTNILLGPRSSTADRKACISVQLPDGDIRDNLNLVDNPAVLRRRIRVKGDVVGSYFGIPGIKNTSEYELL